MADHWTARQRDDGYWYVEQTDGTAILATIGTPATDRERVARLAAAAPDMEEALEAELHYYDVQVRVDRGDEDVTQFDADRAGSIAMTLMRRALRKARQEAPNDR